MSFNVNTFVNALKEGARPNLFSVSIYGSPLKNFFGTELTCKATTIPAMTLGVIEVPFKGRRIKVVGDRTFAEWSATFIADEEQVLYDQFHTWSNFIRRNNYSFDASLGSKTLTDYDSTIVIRHHDDAGGTINYSYLMQAFPTEISQVDLSYDQTDVLSEFTVTFQYQYLLDSPDYYFPSGVRSVS